MSEPRFIRLETETNIEREKAILKTFIRVVPGCLDYRLLSKGNQSDATVSAKSLEGRESVSICLTRLAIEAKHMENPATYKSFALDLTKFQHLTERSRMGAACLVVRWPVKAGYDDRVLQFPFGGALAMGTVDCSSFANTPPETRYKEAVFIPMRYFKPLADYRVPDMNFPQVWKPNSSN